VHSSHRQGKTANSHRYTGGHAKPAHIRHDKPTKTRTKTKPEHGRGRPVTAGHGKPAAPSDDATTPAQGNGRGNEGTPPGKAKDQPAQAQPAQAQPDETLTVPLVPIQLPKPRIPKP